MSTLQHKIDFALVLRVDNANPNGDPLNGNRPRTDYGGLGEITDVCLKRKLRDRLQESGQSVFVQSDDRKRDGELSLRSRAESETNGLGKKAFGKGAKKKTPLKQHARGGLMFALLVRCLRSVRKVMPVAYRSRFVDL
jgi:CRISPR-associated protein Csd2